jgi:signal transduction histidine kinase
MASLVEFFGVDSSWSRPRPPIERKDLLLVAGVEAIGLLGLELVRSVGAFDKTTTPVWTQWLAVSTCALLLLWRRRHPLLVALAAAAHMFVVGVTMPIVMGQTTLQVAYFIAFFSAVSWARDRRLMLVVVGAIVVFMFAWLAWQFTVGSGVQELLDSMKGTERYGVFTPVTAGVLLTFLVNVIYFGGAVLGGQFAWRSARQRARLVEQADTIGEQARALQVQAVIDERLRIARELHDVVGHHVAVIGVQAGAARHVLTRDPESAATALGAIETSSREAVHQMRGLLGTLRDIEESRTTSGTDPSAARSPEPGVGDLAALAAGHRDAGFDVTYDLVESPEGAASTLPGPVSLTLFRVAQEALVNVTRHSTATSAKVVVRVDSEGRRAHAEVEVLDAGRPRPGTSGSGLGQLGIRERAQSLGALVDIGPRATGGYRVRVRVPLGENNDRAHRA